MNNREITVEDKTEVLCLACSTITLKERPTKRQRELNPRGILYCPVCNEHTNHMSIRSLNNLLEKLGAPKEIRVGYNEEKGHQYVKRRGE